MHSAFVKLHLVVQSCDSCAFLTRSRELWTPKGWHNRIRHVDPPESNLFQQLKLTQRARAHDPSPQRRQKMCNCLQMRTPRLLGCVTVEDCEKPARQIAQLSTAQSCDLHVALVGLHLFVSAVDSCTFLNAHREFWTRFGCHNRIRHVDPPKAIFFNT